MKKLIKDNYEVTRARGLITDKTTLEDFCIKINEEVIEFDNECLLDAFYSSYDYFLYEDIKYTVIFDKIKLELSDIILTCFNMATHYGIDIKKALKEKIEINRKRI